MVGGDIINKKLIDDNKREEIFKEELKKLNQEKYITDDVYSTVLNKYMMRKIKKLEKDTVILNTERNIMPEVKQEVKPKRKIKTKEEQREFNLSILLVLGTAFIFLAGLIFGLSSWEDMNEVFRIVTLLLMGTVFFGVSLISETKLKLNKTAFSFWVLGTLFLPLSLFTMKYLTNLGAINGKVFNVVIGFVSLAIFKYTYKKYKKTGYVYMALAAIDFILINVGLIFIKDMVYSVILLILLNGYLMTLNNRYSYMEKVAKVNSFVSLFILILNISNTEIFYINCIAIAILFIYFNYLNAKVVAIYSRTSILMLNIGVLGSCFNLIREYLNTDYVLGIPLLLFILNFALFKVIKKVSSLDDKYFYRYSLIIGFISLAVISLLASPNEKYLLITILGMILNVGLLLYIYNKYKGKKFRIGMKISAVFIILYLIIVTTEIILPKADVMLKLYALIFILFSIWICVREIRFIEVIYKPILSYINIFTLIFAVVQWINMLIEVEAKPVFIPFFLISLVGYYCNKIGLYKIFYKFVAPISAFIGLSTTIILFYMKGLGGFFNENNVEVHLIFMVVSVLVSIFILERVFKYSSKYSICFTLATNIIMIVGIITGIYQWTSLLVILSIVIIISYYGYRLFNKEFLISQYLLSLNSILLTIIILLKFEGIKDIYLLQIPVFIGFIVAMLVYIYFKEKQKLYINLSVFYGLYIIGCNTIEPVSLYVNISIAIVVFVIAYIYKSKALNLLNLIQGILLIVINSSDIKSATLFSTTLFVGAILRIVGIKLYDRFESGNPLDTLSILSFITFFVTLNSYYGQSVVASALQAFISTVIYTAFVIVEIVRRKQDAKIILLISQLILSCGSFITLGEVGVEEKYLSKIALVLLYLVFYSIKRFWNEFYNENMGIVFKVVFTLWCMQDIILYDSILNSIVVSSIIILNMLYFMRKNDKVFVNLSVVNLALIALIQSRSMIFRLPWWVYLTIVGSVFVGIAMYLEKKKSVK